jgi:PKHD-type hydroxylase
VRFEDGRRTAGWHAREVKENEQAIAGDPAAREAAAIVSAALLANSVFRAAALPRRLRPVLFARYPGEGAYGAHTDDALMGLAEPGGPTRADISVTLFLADPNSYDGGELVLESTGGEAVYKLEAGCALAYPATTLHRVSPARPPAGAHCSSSASGRAICRSDPAPIALTSGSLRPKLAVKRKKQRSALS